MHGENLKLNEIKYSVFVSVPADQVAFNPDYGCDHLFSLKALWTELCLMDMLVPASPYITQT